MSPYGGLMEVINNRRRTKWIALPDKLWFDPNDPNKRLIQSLDLDVDLCMG